MPDQTPGRGRDRDGGERPQRPGSRTAAAAAEFLKAAGADLGALAAQLRVSLRRYHRRLTQDPRSRTADRRTNPPHARVVGRNLHRLLLGLAVASIGAVLVISGALLWALLGLPLDQRVTEPRQPTLLLEAANSKPLGRAGPLRMADDSLKDFAPILIKAVLSIEDRRFYNHRGIDFWGILRAAHANRNAGEVVEGGSTITQQLVKREYLGDERSYVRKLREALIAIWLEAHLSKDQILTRYLDDLYLGDGTYGMAAAARLYFNKTVAEVTLSEAAMLAGLIKAPSELDPLRHPQAAEARAAAVLDAMVANHVIDNTAADAAKARPATLNSPRLLAPAKSWFTDWVASQAEGLAGTQSGIVRVRTTLVPELQRIAQQVLDDALMTEGQRLGVSQGALVAMRSDGAVLAMVGGRNYRTSQFNRATDAKRQPGSAFKLFVYLAALRKGYAPQDSIDAAPVDINGWQPANFDNEHFGRITLADAFAQSVNTAAVRLAMNVGLDNVIAAARDLGVTERLPNVPSLALGSVGISLLDMTDAFACVQADRMHLRPWGVAAIGSANHSRLLKTTPAVAEQTLDPYQKPLVDLLRGVVERGTGRMAALDGFAAGKTGTSQDYRDAWFIGFNDALVVGVWVGNDDDRPMKRVVGGSLPVSIWKQFMTKAIPLLDQQGVQVALKTPADASTPQSDQQTMPDEEAVQGSSEPSNPSCDDAACAAKYQSFRPSDCTYQPYYGGPRLRCEKGGPPSDRAAQSADAAATAGGRQCDIALCSQTYSSFNPSDCTYQPYGGGPRQLCEK
ncbi:MAG: PBP1A family penicillin-binding protein [Alphaproteobacteria bacterium]|nr:PBP1A family penicillin-binding protein [Alphaproteobacteria bacterium]